MTLNLESSLANLSKITDPFLSSIPKASTSSAKVEGSEGPSAPKTAKRMLIFKNTSRSRIAIFHSGVPDLHAQAWQTSLAASKFQKAAPDNCCVWKSGHRFPNKDPRIPLWSFHAPAALVLRSCYMRLRV